MHFISRYRTLSFGLLLLMGTLFSSQGNGCNKSDESCYQCQAFGNSPGSDISERVCGSGSDTQSWISGATAEGYQDAYCIPD